MTERNKEIKKINTPVDFFYSEMTKNKKMFSRIFSHIYKINLTTKLPTFYYFFLCKQFLERFFLFGF